MFQGPAVPGNKVHDFHPPISADGLYWVTPVPAPDFVLRADGKTATLKMAGVPVIDQPRWPAMDAKSTPAFMDFTLVLHATDQPVKYEDPMRQYRFEGFKARARLEATFRVPSIDFTFKTDPLDTSKCDFAVMGFEVNGRYYESAKG